jgi:nucleoside-diphosphate-sugar epimerase
VAALSASAGVYNVGDDEPLRREDYFAALAHALGVRPPRIAPGWVAKLGGAKASVMTRSQRLSNRRLVEATGWRPAYPSVREGWPPTVAAAGVSAG